MLALDCTVPHTGDWGSGQPSQPSQLRPRKGSRTFLMDHCITHRLICFCQWHVSLGARRPRRPTGRLVSDLGRRGVLAGARHLVRWALPLPPFLLRKTNDTRQTRMQDFNFVT